MVSTRKTSQQIKTFFGQFDEILNDFSIGSKNQTNINVNETRET